MKKITSSSFFVCILSFMAVAQQSYPVTESMPQTVEGLTAGYNISNEKEKEVGNKGDFSRYSINFYVTNSSNEAKIILNKQGFNLLGSDVSSGLVQFKCVNATGARLTSKELNLQAKPCTLQVLVDDKDCSTGKITQSKRPAQIGYWIRPGETIAGNTIVIVPLNEKPDVTVTFFPNTTNIPATVINNNNNYNIGNNNSNSNNVQNTPSGFVRIKNFVSNNYLHNQNGPVACTTIDHGWWSAQWEILPVSGTNYYQIRNRWKNNFISTENNSMISDNGKSSNAMWLIEETGNNNTYTIKNVANNAKLTYQDGSLKTTNSFLGNQANMQWVIEQ
ncbi:MAG: RICIN domain-containing protein [Chitinophagales bacterium]